MIQDDSGLGSCFGVSLEAPIHEQESTRTNILHLVGDIRRRPLGSTRLLVHCRHRSPADSRVCALSTATSYHDILQPNEWMATSNQWVEHGEARA